VAAFTGTADKDQFTGSTDDDTFDLSQGGDDTANGAGGSDTFTMGSALSAGDRIDGGSGDDAVILNGDYDAFQFAKTTMMHVETLVLTGGHSYDLTAANATVAAGETLTVDASGLTGSDTVAFHADAETNGRYVFRGAPVSEVFVGGAKGDTFYTAGGNDLLYGNGGNDKVVYSGSGALTFYGGDGIDTLDAHLATQQTSWDLGDDIETFIGGSGNDAVYFSDSTFSDTARTISGGAGIDTLQGTGGTDTMSGGSGDDDLTGGNGDDVLSGGIGNDEIEGDGSNYANGNDVLNGGAGNDNLTDDNEFFDSFGNDTLNGGTGDDALFSSGGIDRIDGGKGVDYLWLDRSDATANLTFHLHTITDVTTLAGDGTTVTGVESFTLKTGSGNDTISLLGGNDLVDAGDGNNTVSGGGGDDHLMSGAGTSHLTGGSGNDWLESGSGAFDDVLLGGSGDDTLESAGGADTVDGGAGHDTAVFFDDQDVKLHLDQTDTATVATFEGTNATVVNAEDIVVFAGSHADVLRTAQGDDVLHGGGGKDTLSGGSGDDYLLGEGGDDTIIGGAGEDAARVGGGLYGGAGDDVITGGLGSDTIDGGAGADIIRYTQVADSDSQGMDDVDDFDFTHDRFDFPFAVTGVDKMVTGHVDLGTQGSDAAAAVGAHQLAAHHAVILHCADGFLAGSNFLIVDANGVAGYQDGADYLIWIFALDHASNVGKMDTSDFI
jgi:Ca2+-binding RTX toxin-like protein